MQTRLMFLCLLVLGTITCSLTQHYPHEHLSTPALEPLAKLQTSEYTLRRGETLESLAKLRYGHQHYHSVIKLYNHIENETQIEANRILKTPDVSTILAEEGVTKVIPDEVTLILCSRAKYDKVVGQLWDLRAKAGDGYLVPEDIKHELLEAADDLQQATRSLKLSKAGVKAVPVSMIGQLEQNMELIKLLAEGGHADPNGYDIDIVQQRFALSITYAIIWARNGFK